MAVSYRPHDQDSSHSDIVWANGNRILTQQKLLDTLRGSLFRNAFLAVVDTSSGPRRTWHHTFRYFKQNCARAVTSKTAANMHCTNLR